MGGSGAARVSFCVPACRLAFGEHLRVVGSCPELGGWDAGAAPMLDWSEGDCWVGAVSLPPGDHAFKLVVVRTDGSQRWEDGGDRRLALTGRAMLRATCRFGDTNSTSLDGPGQDMDMPDLQVSAHALLPKQRVPARLAPRCRAARAARAASPPALPPGLHAAG